MHLIPPTHRLGAMGSAPTDDSAPALGRRHSVRQGHGASGLRLIGVSAGQVVQHRGA